MQLFHSQMLHTWQQKHIGDFSITFTLPPLPSNQWIVSHSDLNELNNSFGYRCLAEFLQVLHNIWGLQPYADSCIEGIGCELVLMDMVRPAHWLCNGYQEVLGIFIHWWEGFQKDVSIWGLERNAMKKEDETGMQRNSNSPCNVVWNQKDEHKVLICNMSHVRKATIQTCLTTQRGREEWSFFSSIWTR